MRPLLRWAGSKRQHLGSLAPYWLASGATRYVEPFAGSAALYFELEPEDSLLNDTNDVLANFYRVLCSDPEAVYELAVRWPDREKTYYEVRDAFKVERDPIKRAAMFFYLNRRCFNGIYRTNVKGEFNVPYGGAKSGALPDWDEVSTAVQLLKSSDIYCQDFRTLLRESAQENDFIYLDPPYAVENRRVFVQYNAQTFGLADLHELSEALHSLDAIGAKFVVSYALCPEALHVFSAWPIRRVACQRNVAGFAAHRRKAIELLVSNIRGVADE